MSRLPTAVHDANVSGASHAPNVPTLADVQARYLRALRDRDERSADLFAWSIRHAIAAARHA
jgi:hypothetical protein